MKAPWKQFRTTNIQAKTSVFSFTANRPITQVTPSNGSRINEALTMDLYNLYVITHECKIINEHQ